jgi:small subunit ribosomal protein S23
VSGLLKSGALKWEERPLFYDIYTAFPPLKERKYKEPVADEKPLRPIFYPEDKERACLDYTNMPAFNMFDKRPTKTQIEFKEKVIEGKLGESEKLKINTQELFKEI